MDLSQRLHRALQRARDELLAVRAPEGHWVGELSSSALSTATAVCALAVVDRESAIAGHGSRITRGLDWLAAHVNADSGWGDTTLSLSNISTTTLGRAAFGVVPGGDEKYRGVVKSAERWLAERAGGITPEKLAPAIIARYGKDRTFSVPILTTCALSGRLGFGADVWKWVLPLPFELAALPHQFFAALRLPVVSYALPALIAIGQSRHHHLPSRNPVARIVRNLTRARTLDVLTDIQPSSGGFLEATPLTSFVVMSLAGSGQVDHPVTKKGVEFLVASQRADGSWPIDTNLATWVTTLSVNALASGSAGGSPAVSGGPPETFLAEGDRARVRDWLLAQQYRKEHPYTHAAPGGWAWTDLPGGVPDADDTAGALLALHNLTCRQRPAGGSEMELPPGYRKHAAVDESTCGAVTAGVTWLLNLQNSDGGIPTFCRGWTNLPFDRSAPDLTGHALRAWNAWLPDLPTKLQRRVRRAMERGVHYLARKQRPDGSWIPLWFGNQHLPDETNPVYGTAKVLIALSDLEGSGSSLSLSGRRQSGALQIEEMAVRAAQWFASTQHNDGSWGAPDIGAGSVEETALAVEALAAVVESGPATCRPSRSDGRDAVPAALNLGTHAIREAAIRGANWLIEKVESGEWRQPAPIGFYFAKLWYYERLYPRIFAVAALSRIADTFHQACEA